MPPYIPPNARPPPAAPSSSTWSSPRAGQGRGRGTPSIRPDGLKMARKEIGKKPGEMEMLASPSRGIDGNDEASLRNFQVQERFRDHIGGKIMKLDSEYPSGRKDCWPKRKEELGIILLDFRKLREGLTSSKRMDAFAAEVYETAINYAIEAQNFQQVGASLPFLVFELHPFLASSKPSPLPSATQSEEDQMTTSLAGISLGFDASDHSSKEDRRALYQSLYLIHLMIVLNEITSFYSTLALFTSPSASSTSSTSTPQSLNGLPRPILRPPLVPTLHPHLLFAWRIFQSLLSTNYVKLSRLISLSPSPAPSSSTSSLPPPSEPDSEPHPLLLSLIHSHLHSVRERTWMTLAKSYKVEKDFQNLNWLEQVLLFDVGGSKGKGEKEERRKKLIDFLRTKGKGVSESAWD